ncbi:MAG: DUF721 domain-containing protein [Spirochaetaceae bacterium]|jgi:hypothetical protein|nr:DUF721 domain-containing protein [Spirochaetaceae bacterium]
MKRAGDYLAAIIDANLYSKAKVYSGFFSSWDQIVRGCGIASGHSRVRELERGILVVEADHPGWIQILQTKAPEIISAARRRFPELDIRAISFTLSKPHGPEESPGAALPPEKEPVREDAGRKPKEDRSGSWEQIGDPELKDSLKRLERSIGEREKSAGRRTRGKK